MKRRNILKAMNTIVRALNDETAYYRRWIYIIPDEADDDELEDIADNMPDIFEEAVELFGDIMRSKRYTEGGIYVEGKVYALREDE